MSRVAGRALVAAIVGGIGAVAIGTGLWLAGSPSEARLRRLDDRRVSDLQQLGAAVDLHWTRTGRLPADLAELPAGGRETAPAAGGTEPYTYRVVGGAKYELCATFDRSDSAPSGPRPGSFWAHNAGRQCFTLEARRVER